MHILCLNNILLNPLQNMFDILYFLNRRYLCSESFNFLRIIIFVLFFYNMNLTYINKTYLKSSMMWLRCDYYNIVPDGDVKFDIQIWSYLPQMGQIWDFLRSVSVHFGAGRQNALKLILKSPRFVSFGANLTQFGCQV